MTGADVVARVKPTRMTVAVCVDGDLSAEIERLEAELAKVDTDTISGGRKLAKRIADLREQAVDSQVEFTFQSIGRTAWADLIAKHPPDDKMLRLGLDHDPGTFLPEAIAVSCVEPELTVEDVEALAEKLNFSQFNLLRDACFVANTRSGLPGPLSSRASRVLQASNGSSEPPESGDSLAASS